MFFRYLYWILCLILSFRIRIVLFVQGTPGRSLRVCRRETGPLLQNSPLVSLQSLLSIQSIRCWLAAAMYYTYGVQIMKVFLPEIPHLEILIQYHKYASCCLFFIQSSLICTCLYSFNFILFVLSLKKGCLKYQISIRLFSRWFIQLGQIAWTLLNIVLVVMQTSSMITNMSEGMLWFFFPVLLVCINDTCAYIFGKLFGKKYGQVDRSHE